jgi:hypothetical protein
MRAFAAIDALHQVKIVTLSRHSVCSNCTNNSLMRRDTVNAHGEAEARHVPIVNASSTTDA